MSKQKQMSNEKSTWSMAKKTCNEILTESQSLLELINILGRQTDVVKKMEENNDDTVLVAVGLIKAFSNLNKEIIYKVNTIINPRIAARDIVDVMNAGELKEYVNIFDFLEAKSQELQKLCLKLYGDIVPVFVNYNKGTVNKEMEKIAKLAKEGTDGK